jgi:xanthine dehydrogenase YagS FAD-binding subunit
VALSALQAQLTVAGPNGNRSVKIQDFFVGPDKDIQKENTLLQNEIITEIILPPIAGKMRSSYRKIRSRGAWDFASVSVAIAAQLEGQNISAARIFLGGVGPYPWRVEGAEKALVGKKIDASVAAAAGQAATEGNTPLRDNGYKVVMVKGAVEESILAFA